MTSLPPGEASHFHSAASLLVNEELLVTILTVTLLPLETNPKANILSRSGAGDESMSLCLGGAVDIIGVFGCFTAVVPSG